MKRPEAVYCNYCAHGSHTLCHLDGCECADRKHDPEVRVAAAMRIYQRPDLLKDAPSLEVLASQWRKLTSA